MKIARMVLVLVLVLTCLATMAASCEPPDPTPPVGCYFAPDGSLICPPPSWDSGIQATATYGAEEFHKQLTAMATDENR